MKKEIELGTDTENVKKLMKYIQNADKKPPKKLKPYEKQFLSEYMCFDRKKTKRGAKK